MTTFYKHVVVDFPHPYMKFVVGKKGKTFKQCCTSTGVHSIWFNMKRNIVEIYGPKQNLEQATVFLENKMNKVRSKVPQEELDIYRKNITIPQEHNIVGSLDNALTKDEVKHLIGKNGKNFKKITHESNVSFIWYDEPTHNITIWGPQDNLNIAIKMLFDMISKVKEKQHVHDMDMEYCN